MNNLTNKKILLGISGSIAAYKCAELTRRLKEHGAEIRVVMTKNANQFITPITMGILSGKSVYEASPNASADINIEHISLARWCDCILVAPASANCIARLALGLADELLTSLCLATTAPIAIAPAMNQQMWAHPATQENVVKLDKRGIIILGPNSGDQACGETGEGRMLEVPQLISEIDQLFAKKLLAGKNIMVTAGPTREAIDPVRYITNHSSGRMGYAIARAAAESGANVRLVSGATAIKAPSKVHYIGVDTAKQMLQAVMSNISGVDIFIAAAAVADYRCAEPAEHKIKKQADHLSLHLKKNADILTEVVQLETPPFTVGFAAETEDLFNNAHIKLQNKKIDILAANQVGKNMGFDVDKNELQVFWRTKNQRFQHRELPCAPKEKLARQLIKIIAERYYEKNPD